MSETDLVGPTSISELLSVTKIMLLLFGLVCLAMAVKFLSSLSGHLNQRMPSKRILIAQVITIISFSIYILGGGYLVYGVIQPPKALLLAVSGTLAVALGLSIKDLVASVVAGVILLFDRPFQVGDRITFDGSYGEVSSVGLRAVRMITLDDSVVTIPNNRFINDLVTSGNFGALDMMIEINFHVDLSADLAAASQALYEVAVTSRFVFLKKPVVLVLNEVDFAQRPAMQIRVKCYVIDVRFEKALQTDIFLRGTKVLADLSVQRPTFSGTTLPLA